MATGLIYGHVEASLETPRPSGKQEHRRGLPTMKQVAFGAPQVLTVLHPVVQQRQEWAGSIQRQSS